MTALGEAGDGSSVCSEARPELPQTWAQLRTRKAEADGEMRMCHKPCDGVKEIAKKILKSKKLPDAISII